MQRTANSRSPCGALPVFPLPSKASRVTGWADNDTNSQLIGCLFAPTGFEPFFTDLDFVTTTAREYVRPMYAGLFAGVKPLPHNVIAMHFLVMIFF